MNSHRIEQTQVVTTVQRQTPKNEFGDVLAETLGQVGRTGAAIVGGALGNPVVSAAVTAVSGAIGITQAGTNKPQALASSSYASTSSHGAAPAASDPTHGAIAATAGSSTNGSAGPSGNGDQWDLLNAQKAMQNDSQSWNAMYLQIQDQMQRESRQFTTVSNIMKVRNDTAKNAINNIH